MGKELDLTQYPCHRDCPNNVLGRTAELTNPDALKGATAVLMFRSRRQPVRVNVGYLTIRPCIVYEGSKCITRK